MRLLLSIPLAISSLAGAQEPVTLPAPGVTPPTLEHSVDPAMPHRFFAGKTQVLVGCVVNVQGLPENVRVRASGGKKYDEAAITAVKQYVFHPAEKNGTPVPVSIDVQVNFQYLRK